MQFNRSDFQETYEKLQADFAQSGGVHCVKVDVTDPQSVENAAIETFASAGNGRIDILCCFAGVVGCQHFLDMKPEEYKRVMDVNATGTFLCSQAVARQMVKQQPPGGSIVHISCASSFLVSCHAQKWY